MLRHTALSLLFLCCLTGATDADWQNRIYELAFTPERNFTGESSEFDSPTLTVVYRGDDYDVPVYSMAIASICPDAFNDQDCSYDESKFVARMVRSPIADKEDRPRAAGFELLEKLRTRKAIENSKLVEAFDDGLVEWLETDLDRCAGSAEMIEAIRSANWSPEPAMDWDSKYGETSDEITVTIHADTLAIQYAGDNGLSSYEGQIDRYGLNDDIEYDDSWTHHVSTMVIELNKVLEPCWTKSESLPPWHRKFSPR